MVQSVVFFTGFETGDASGINSPTGVVVTSPVRTGGYAYQCDATQSPIPIAAQTMFSARFGFYAGGTFASQIVLRPRNGSGGGVLFALRTTAAGQFDILDAGGLLGISTVTGTVAIAAGVWVTVEVAVDLAAGGVVKTRINGILDINTTHPTDATATPITSVGLLGRGTPNFYYVDDIRIDGGGTAFVGPGQCIARQGIAGTPAYDNATKNGGATAAACWSDTPFDTTNFTTETTNGEFQTMLVGSFATDPSRAVEGTQVIRAADTINAVKVGMVAKTSSTASDGENMSMRRRVGGGNTDTAKLLTTSDAYYETALFTDTVANLNSYEIGGGKTGAQASTITIRDMWLMVDYTPQSPGSAAGIGTATGVGASTAASTAAAAGTGAAAGVGASTAASTAAAAGTGATAGVSASIAATVGAVAGTGTVSGVGAAIVSGVGSSAGVGDSSAAATAISSAVGVVAGIGAAVSVGESTVLAAGLAAGTSAAAGVGASVAAAVGSAAGAGAVVGIGASLQIVSAIGFAAGSGAAAGVGVAFHPRLGTAGRVNSSSNMSDFVRSLQVASVRRAVQIVESRPSQVVSGRRVAQQAVEPRPVGLQRRLPRGYGLGAAAGVGTAAAVAAVIAAAVGVASGIGGVTAFGTVIVAAVGVASGVGSGLAIGTGAVAGVGVAVGAGDVTGIGTGVVAAMGVAVGAGSVSASSTLSNALSLGTDLLTLGGDQLTLGP